MLGFNTRHIQNDRCNLFSNTANPCDTLTLNVNFLGLVRLPDHIPLSYLEKKKLLKVKNFKSSLQFQAPGCPFEYNLVYGDQSKEGKRTVVPQNIGKKVQITCVIYNDRNIPYYQNEPFVVITKIRTIE